MGLEVATHINDLITTNPLPGDKKKEGDDQIRLLKTVLRTNFPNADRPFRFPEAATKNVNSVLSVNDDGKLIIAQPPGAAMTITLPTPTYDGWYVDIIKDLGNSEPVYVFPPGGVGTILTSMGFVSKVRINSIYSAHRFYWGGASFVRLSPPGEEMPGTLSMFGGPTPPVGYAFAVGQAISIADHPELFLGWGTTWGTAGPNFNAPDMRDRFPVGAGLTYPVGGGGGAATHTLTVNELPVHNHGTGLVTSLAGIHSHALSGFGIASDIVEGGGVGVFAGAGGSVPTDNEPDHQHTVDTLNVGGGAAHNNLPPYRGLNFMFRLC